MKKGFENMERISKEEFDKVRTGEIELPHWGELCPGRLVKRKGKKLFSIDEGDHIRYKDLVGKKVKKVMKELGQHSSVTFKFHRGNENDSLILRAFLKKNKLHEVGFYKIRNSKTQSVQGMQDKDIPSGINSTEGKNQEVWTNADLEEHEKHFLAQMQQVEGLKDYLQTYQDAMFRAKAGLVSKNF